MGKRLALLGIAVLVVLVGAYGLHVYYFGADTVPVVNVTPTPPVAEITLGAVQGDVQRLQGEEWVPVRTGDVLDVDDQIRTGPNSTAEMRLGKNATVYVSADTSVRPGDITERLARLQLDSGHVRTVVHGASDRELSMTFAHSDAELVAAAGEYSALAGKSGQVTVTTTRGLARFTNAGKTVEIKPGQQSVSLSGKPPTPPASTPKELLVKLGKPSRSVQRERFAVVRGSAPPGSLVWVGDQEITPGEDGEFETRVTLSEGENKVVVRALDAMGRRKRDAYPSIKVDTQAPKVKSTVTW